MLTTLYLRDKIKHVAEEYRSNKQRKTFLKSWENDSRKNKKVLDRCEKL